MQETGIKSAVIKEICTLAEKYNIEKVILFGSRARGDYKRASDIDLAVQGGDIFRFALDVEEETSTPLKYDVVNLDGAVQTKLREAIEQEGRTLYEKNWKLKLPLRIQGYCRHSQQYPRRGKYENYISHLRVLERADREKLDNEFIISGIIDKFSIQFELGWKVLKELLAYEGSRAAATGSPRSIIKESYAVYPFFDGEIWMDMLKDRNDMAHIYNGEAARELVERILKVYIPQFIKLEAELNAKYGTVLETL